MRKVLAVCKIVALIVYTLSTYAIYFIGMGIVKLFRLRLEPWKNLFMKVWSGGVAFIFNLHIEKEGDPPNPPFFIVSNHLSYLDIIPLFLNLSCTFVAKKEVQNWPILGPMVKSVGVIFIDRNKRTDVKRVNELLSHEINRYQGLIVFPEGTSSGGEQVLPFHSSLLELPAASSLPVHAASLSYKTARGDLPARDSVCFFGARESFISHVYKLAQTRKVCCKIRFGTTPLQTNDRKELAEGLHQNVQKIFEPTSVSADKNKSTAGSI